MRSSPPDPTAFNALVWEIVQQIPPGYVSAYGQIASMIPPPSGVDPLQYARLGAIWVGYAMHAVPEGSAVPWHRVINSQGQISLPEVDTSNAETDVIIQDGKTIIIAGLIKETRSQSESKVPFLGDIPLIGKLFKSKYDSNEMKELVIFITPHIISGEEDLLYLDGREKARKPPKQ